MRKFMYIFAPLALAGKLLGADSSFNVTWKLDPSQSSGDAIPKEETIVIMDDGNNVHVTLTGTSEDGTPIAITYVIPMAGGDGQVAQGPYDSVSGKRIDDNTRDVTYGKSGNRSQQHQVVSKDGKTMRVTKKGKDAQGNTVNSTEVYNKQ